MKLGVYFFFSLSFSLLGKIQPNRKQEPDPSKGVRRQDSSLLTPLIRYSQFSLPFPSPSFHAIRAMYYFESGDSPIIRIE